MEYIKRHKGRRARTLLVPVCAAALLAALAGTATAQDQADQPEVLVNLELLNSLGRGPIAVYVDHGYAVQGQEGQVYLSQPGILRQPPSEAPRSQLTVTPPTLGAEDDFEALLLTERPSLEPPPEAPPPQAELLLSEETEETGAVEAVPEAPAPDAPAIEDRAEAPEQPEIPAPSVAEEAAQAAAQIEPAEGGSDAAAQVTGASQAEASAPAAPPAPELPAETAETAGAESAPAETQQAALTTGQEDGQMRLLFNAGSADLSDAAKSTLRDLTKELDEDAGLRIQLLGYASASDDSASRAKRLSLSRALTARAYLIDQGVSATRIDIRALGTSNDGGPSDRVDVVPAVR